MGSVSHHAHSKGGGLQSKFRSYNQYVNGPRHNYCGSTSTISTLANSEPISSLSSNRQKRRNSAESHQWVPPPIFVPGFHNVKAVKQMSYRRLGNTHVFLSKIGLGGGPLGGLYGTCRQPIDIVHSALKNGVTIIDTSYWYGQTRSEEIIGQALHTVPRRAYFIATKVGRYELDYAIMNDLRKRRVLQSIDESIGRLGTGYLDICLVQIHGYHEFAPSESLILNETLPALAYAKQMGKIKCIGLTSYHLAKMTSIVSSSTVNIDVIFSYCRGTLADGALGSYCAYFQSRNIAVVNCSATGQGLLTIEGAPAWHPAPRNIKDACHDAVEYCRRKRISITRLATHYAVNFPGTHSCLVGAHSIEILFENIRDALAQLTEKEAKVRDRIMRRHLDPLANANWEDINITRYWNRLHRIGLAKNQLELALPLR